MTAIERLRKEFYKDKTGAVMVISASNRFYLTGVSSSDGIVLITPDNSYFIVDFRYYEAALRKAEGFKPLLAENGLFACARKLCKAENISRLYIEDNFVTVAENKRIENIFDGIELDLLGDALENMRIVKTADEIERIRKSQQLTDAAYEHIVSYLDGAVKRGVTENDVACELDFFIRKNGAEGMAFKTIVVSGKNSSLPHGEPSDTVLTQNSFLTMDYGAVLDGYCSDMTRTVVIGKADGEMREIYSIVLSAQKNALNKIKAGIKGGEVDAAARNIIIEAGYGKCFGHSTGHALGIDVHELPSYSPKYDKEIPQNAVLSVEPGIYIPEKYGVRIEDIAVVGCNGIENLTKSPKNLTEI